MAGRVKTWVWIIVAVAVVCVLGLVAMAGVGFYFASQHIATRAVSPGAAAEDFDTVRKRFTGQSPIIELDDRGRFVRARTERASANPQRPPEWLRVLAYDADDGRVVEVKVPFWLLRMKLNASIDLNGRQMDFDDLRMSVEDLERFGPALIAEHKAPDGSRVLVWSE